MKWYKRDPDAALAGMIGLGPAERGIYNTIIDLLYSRNGDLPDRTEFLLCAFECHGSTWRSVKQSLIEKGKIWVTPDGKLMAKRVETALKEAANFSETQSKRSSKRWQKSKNRSDINGSHMPSSAMPPGDANTTTTTTTPLTPFENGFDKFWNSYPRKVGKEDAAKAYAKALKHVSLIEILEALEKQKPQWRDPKFIPYPASWLNAGRWADELPIAKPPGREGWV